eukprot:8322156-Heterocapsa_arctica.AAC.1
MACSILMARMAEAPTSAALASPSRGACILSQHAYGMGMMTFSPTPIMWAAPAAAIATQRVSPGSRVVSQVRRSMLSGLSRLAPWACSHVGGRLAWSWM